MPKIKPVMAWGGFTDGKLSWTRCLYSGVGVTAIFERKSKACQMFADVRRVRISVVPKAKRKVKGK